MADSDGTTYTGHLLTSAGHDGKVLYREVTLEFENGEPVTDFAEIYLDDQRFERIRYWKIAGAFEFGVVPYSYNGDEDPKRRTLEFSDLPVLVSYR